MDRSCVACGSALKSSNPRKKFCNDACRKRGSRGATVTPIADGDADSSSAASSTSASVADATRSALEEVGRLGHPAGAAAMILARRLDRGGDTGSAVAALTRELRATLAEALARATAEADPIDELQRKREQRLHAV